MRPAETRPAWIEVDLGAIVDNVRTLRELAAPAVFLAVVKANGYGHGAEAVARAALTAGATWLAVATPEEGGALRDAGITAPILLLSEAFGDGVDAVVRQRLTPTVYTDDAIDALSDAAARQREAMPAVHLKVDTGMHRVGAPAPKVVELARKIVASGAALEGVWTHLAVADEPGRAVTVQQLDRFDAVRAELRTAGFDPPLVHAANSAGTIAHPRSRYSMVRCGIAIYGLTPSPELSGCVPLRPALALRARVTARRTVSAGEGISYGHRYASSSTATVVTVPLGYADGVPRRLGAVGGEAIVRGQRVPIAGTVTMDQLMLDVGDLPVIVGEEVTLIGMDGEVAVTADEWAEKLDTINYEIVTRLGNRIPRRHLDRGVGAA